MSKFLSELCVENASAMDDGNWRLTAPLVYQSDVAGMTFTVPAGFVTNYASVPRVFLAYEMFGNTANEAAVVHDFAYTAPSPVARSVADAVFREAAILTGVPKWKADAMYEGVRLFGESHYNTA